MKESDLRKWHRNLGILLFIFIILQAGSGLFITLTNLSVPHTHAHGNAPRHIEDNEKEKPMLHESQIPEGDAAHVNSHEAEPSILNKTHAHENALEHEESRQPEKSGWTKSLELIHHGGGAIGTIYRLIVGIGLLVMAVSGGMIFVKFRSRTRKS